MSTSTFSKLWEESKIQHRTDAEALANEFVKDFEKTWSLLLRPFFYAALFVPSFRRQFVIERNVIRGELKKIVVEYVPQIRIELTQWEEGFNQWEKENSGPSLCGSDSASSKERRGKENAKRISAEMITKIGVILKYDRHFHPIEDPSKMVMNPYPGYLTTERAINYCDYLMQVFG